MSESRISNVSSYSSVRLVSVHSIPTPDERRTNKVVLNRVLQRGGDELLDLGEAVWVLGERADELLDRLEEVHAYERLLVVERALVPVLLLLLFSQLVRLADQARVRADLVCLG